MPIGTRKAVLNPVPNNLSKILSHAQVYYTDFDQGNTITDKSGHGNNGTVNGTVTNKTGQNGQNLKSFNAAGNISLPWNPNTNFLYPFEKKFIRELSSLYVHEGITSDGTNWYLLDAVIRKVDKDFNILASHFNIFSEITGNHVGDGDYYDGKLYTVTQTYTNCTTFSDQAITVFDASDLSLISTHDISAQGVSVDGITVDADNGFLYVVSYCDGTKFWKYNLSDLSYIGTVSFSSVIAWCQGVKYFNGDLYISTNTQIIRTGINGAIKEILVLYPPATNIEGEGLHVVDSNTIYAIFASEAGNNLYEFTKKTNAFTMTIWLNPGTYVFGTSNGVMRFFATEDDNLNLFIRTSPAQLELKVNSATGSGLNTTRARITQADALIVQNKMQMFTIAFDGRYANLYVNDAKQGANSSYDTQGVAYALWNLTIGGSTTNSPTWDLRGDVGEFAILDYAMTHDDIKRFYNLTRGKYGV